MSDPVALDHYRGLLTEAQLDQLHKADEADIIATIRAEVLAEVVAELELAKKAVRGFYQDGSASSVLAGVNFAIGWVQNMAAPE
jgi:hypothetical protein